MSKHRHTKDKQYITYTEQKEVWQGKKNKKTLPFVKLPFQCCALSLSPFQNPVCTVEGNIFDIIYIMPFIKKYGRCPITGRALTAKQLIKMSWSKNQKDEYWDPISYKVFTEYTHIVCIRTSGQVYAFQTVMELNKKQKFYFDLITNDPFKPEDIINIQDPKNTKQLQSFDYLKNNIPFVPPEKLAPTINENETLNRINEQLSLKRKAQHDIRQEETEIKKKKKLELESREDVKGFLKWCIENKVYQHDRETSRLDAGSLTSTNFTPQLSSKMTFRQLKESQVRDKVYQQVKKQKMKGQVLLVTNMGNFTLLIHCDLVPKTGENFIELCENKYYDGILFHRLVKDFCLQGGDPTGTGTGGESIFGKPFEDEIHKSLKHNKAGILSMANAGQMTNTSQFFITLAQAPYLDQKHTVFGEVISQESMTILLEINRNLTSKTNKPKRDIIIEKMVVFDNPYRKVIKKMKQQYENKKDIKEISQLKSKERWIQDQNKGFKLPDKKIFKNEKSTKEQGLTSMVLKDYY